MNRPGVLLGLFNECLQSGTFPECWKVARLVLLPKGKGKPPSEASSYRPLSLLGGVGKLFERLLLKRINAHLLETQGLSSQQFGFRIGVSTLDAVRRVIHGADEAASGPARKRDLCAVVALDVKNAFNSAPWRMIDAALRRMEFSSEMVRFMRSYMSKRVLVVEDNGAEVQLAVSSGVPQGSVIGPVLWNILYDGLLWVDLGPMASLVGFADDVALLIRGHTTELVESVGAEALQQVHRWMSTNGLELAPHKSEAVMLTKKRAYREPVFTM